MSSNKELGIWAERRNPDGQRPNDYRTPYARDRARIIHSSAFRRLQAKTQVLGVGTSDFSRTRLTHSMEVAQIAVGIVDFLRNQNIDAEVKKWLPDRDLMEAISLAHDIGHPPFGHAGEAALNFMMREAGGFEGNGQNIRLLARLESHTEDFGLNVTRRTLLGILKYPVSYTSVVRKKLPGCCENKLFFQRNEWKPPKCYLDTEADIIDWVFKPFSEEDRNRFTELKSLPKDDKHGKSSHHALDTCILEIADDIAYGVHDLEDAIALGFITFENLEEILTDFSEGEKNWIEERLENKIKLHDIFSGLTERGGCERKSNIGLLVNLFVGAVFIEEKPGFDHPLLKFRVNLDDNARLVLDKFNKLILNKVIKSQSVQTLEYRGQQLILAIFEAIQSDPESLLKEGFRKSYSCYFKEKSRIGCLRVICDYISGMTDEYATRMYERLFMPRHGHAADRL